MVWWKQEHLSYRQARWVMFLQELDFRVEYLPGKFNSVADYLSRSPLVVPLCALCGKGVEHMELSKKVNINKLEITQLTFVNRLRHQGAKRSLWKLAKRYYWPKMEEDVKLYVRSCDECQRSLPKLNVGWSHPLQVPEDRFQQVGMDFAVLPESKSGMNMVIVLIDYLTKLVCFIPCKKTVTTEEVAMLVFKNWYCTGKGLPDCLVSDRDAKFVAKVWVELCKQVGVVQAMSTARH